MKFCTYNFVILLVLVDYVADNYVTANNRACCGVNLHGKCLLHCTPCITPIHNRQIDVSEDLLSNGRVDLSKYVKTMPSVPKSVYGRFIPFQYLSADKCTKVSFVAYKYNKYMTRCPVCRCKATPSTDIMSETRDLLRSVDLSSEKIQDRLLNRLEKAFATESNIQSLQLLITEKLFKAGTYLDRNITQVEQMSDSQLAELFAAAAKIGLNSLFLR